MAERNPLLAMLPEQSVLVAVQKTNPVMLHSIFEQISSTAVEMVEIAHREDHQHEELGGDHERTGQVASSLYHGLMERYGEHPEVIAQLYADLIIHTGLAAGSDELHAALTDEERQKLKDRDRG